MIKTICVFCGSSPGNSPVYGREAEKLGRFIADGGYNLVYGGSDVGLMGIIARTALEGGAAVTGIIPQDIFNSVGHENDAELIVVPSMHERKQKMYDLADAFIAFCGGIGTLEEIFEVLTWGQLGYHAKPAGFLNIEGYFNRLLGFLDDATANGFIKSGQRERFLSAGTPEDLMKQFGTFDPRPISKWSKMN